MADELVRLTDEVLDLFDVAMTTIDRKARLELEAITKTNAAAASDTVRLSAMWHQARAHRCHQSALATRARSS